jgi:hypothetical protein
MRGSGQKPNDHRCLDAVIEANKLTDRTEPTLAGDAITIGEQQIHNLFYNSVLNIKLSTL